jgi:hypothetical protein
MRIGYAWVSSIQADRQDHKTQVAMLKAAGCSEILTERGSGAKRDRPVMKQVMVKAIQAAADGAEVEIIVVRHR